MLPSLIVFVVTYGLIVSERVDRAAAAMLGAAVIVLLGIMPYEAAVERVDLNVVFLLVGMMLVVSVLADTGLFEWVAVVIAQKGRGNGLVILIGLLSATAVLSAFLDNVTTVVLIVPITILITQILEIPTTPFLILAAVFSNIGGTATLIGDPPNILIGSKSHLTFNDFLVHLGPIVLVMMAATLAGVALVFGKSFYVVPEARQRIMKAQPRRAITDPVRLRRGLPVFGATLIGFSASHLMGVEPGIVALAGGFVLLAVCGSDVRATLEKVEWNTIFFLIGLFMLVGALEYHGLFDMLGGRMFAAARGNLALTAIIILWLSALLSAVAGAIPVVIAFIPLTQSMVDNFGTLLGLTTDAEQLRITVTEPLFWALALGACLGGNGTLFGTAANVVVAQIGARNKYNITYWDFARYGAPVMLLTLIISTMYLYLRYL